MSDTSTSDDDTQAPGERPEGSEGSAPDPGRHALLADLGAALGDELVDSHLIPGTDLWVRVATGAWTRAATTLHGMGFTFFGFLSAIDWLPSPYGRGEEDPTAEGPERQTEIVQGYAGGETRFQVFARLVHLRRRLGVTLKADVPDDTMSIGSWSQVYAGANWHERETHEMFGITFHGHPDLRNLYLPTEFEGYPLRKDFPLLARMIKPWPGIVDVEPLPPEDDEAAADEVLHAPADEAAVAAAEHTPDTEAQQTQEASAGEAGASQTASQTANQREGDS